MSERRGVLYVAWNLEKREILRKVLERSKQSLRKHHPDIPITVHCVGGDSPGLLDKASMYDISPYEETLYLDLDTVVLDNLNFGFEQAARHDVACSICECPWARRYAKSINGDLIEYNTGVLFWRKGERTAALFNAWNRLARAVDSSMDFQDPQGKLATMDSNDQAGFALAVHETGLHPFVLPLNWNFRPRQYRSFFGPIKVWHDFDDPPPGLVRVIEEQAKPTSMIRYFTSG